MSSKISSRIHGRSAGPTLIHKLSRELAALAHDFDARHRKRTLPLTPTYSAMGSEAGSHELAFGASLLARASSKSASEAR